MIPLNGWTHCISKKISVEKDFWPTTSRLSGESRTTAGSLEGEANRQLRTRRGGQNMGENNSTKILIAPINVKWKMCFVHDLPDCLQRTREEDDLRIYGGM